MDSFGLPFLQVGPEIGVLSPNILFIQRTVNKRQLVI